MFTPRRILLAGAAVAIAWCLMSSTSEARRWSRYGGSCYGYYSTCGYGCGYRTHRCYSGCGYNTCVYSTCGVVSDCCRTACWGGSCGQGSYETNYGPGATAPSDTNREGGASATQRPALPPPPATAPETTQHDPNEEMRSDSPITADTRNRPTNTPAPAPTLEPGAPSTPSETPSPQIASPQREQTETFSYEQNENASPQATGNDAAGNNKEQNDNSMD